MPTRIDGGLFASAKASGAQHSRSAAQQIDYWARIGRELDNAAGVSHREIEAVLKGEASYDALNDREQAVVRVEWDQRIADGIAGLDFQKEFSDASDTWVVGDDDGHAVVKSARDA